MKKNAVQRRRGHLSLQHQQEVQVLREELGREQERANLSALDISALKTLHQQELNSLMQEAQDVRSLAEQLEAKVQVLEEKQIAYEEQIRVHAEEMSLMKSKHLEVLEANLQEQRENYKRRRKRKRRGLRSSGKKSKRAMRRC